MSQQPESEPDWLMISALQYYAYCPRQFALIHIEQAWAENQFTAHGRLLHERVDSYESEQRGDVSYERSISALKLSVWRRCGRSVSIVALCGNGR